MNNDQNIPNFIAVIDEVLLEKQAENKARGANYEFRHAPSSASVRIGNKVVGSCNRALYYKATKTPPSETTEVASLWKFGLGNAVHEWLQDVLKKSHVIGFIAESYARVKPEHLDTEVAFRLDGLADYKGNIGVLEIKTTGSSQITGNKYFQGIRDTGPKPEALIQVIDYLNLRPVLKWGAIVYVARDTGYRLQFNITKDPNGDIYYLDGKRIEDITFAKIIERRKELENAISANVPPARDYKNYLGASGKPQDSKTVDGKIKKSDWQCSYCDWKTTCWTSPGAEKDAKQ